MTAKPPAEQVAAEREPMRVSIDLDDYPMREKIDLEVALGAPLGDLFPAGQTLSYRALAGLAWLTKRRSNPGLTWNAFVDSNDEHWTGHAPDPTPPGDSPGGEPERSQGSSATTPALA